jgi:eukaryotic-like serine/threonine-protein kinase
VMAAQLATGANARRRFAREAQAAAAVSHDHVVTIHAVEEANGLPYLVMQCVAGLSLQERLDRDGPLELHEVLRIGMQTASGLAAAHVQGVVHRDIKPANLILTSGGTLKVADFGIARIDTTTLTMTGMVMGTPSYMSPEQCQGGDSDHRSDLFSAGVVLYELLTGERPFRGSPEMIAYNICNEVPRPPSELSSLTLPSALDDIIATALAKSPDARFQNAYAFHHALQLAAGSSRAGAGTAVEATVVNLARVELGPPSAAQWDDTTLSTVERNFARYVGPVAKVLVRKAATKAQDVTELYSLLASNIDDDDERARFVATMPGASTAAGLRTLHTGAGLVGSLGLSTGSRGTTPQSERSGSIGTRTLPPIPLEPQFVHETTQRLLVYLGPIGRVVAKKAAEQAKSQQEFVEIVAGHIGTQDRGAFLKEVGF